VSTAEFGPARGTDGLLRCPWATSSPEYVGYHDTEWGRPVVDDNGLFERLSLEGFQSGLSWLTILRKREAFRTAFAAFEIERVARFTSRDVNRLLRDRGIVRNRRKIEAVIDNAGAAESLAQKGTSLSDLVWSFAPKRRPAPRTLADVAASTDESKLLAAALKENGFRWVGPTTVYALMQACGIVNDHLLRCSVRKEVEADRLAL
jgi:DNA-3-methyladenine glycosylase I